MFLNVTPRRKLAAYTVGSSLIAMLVLLLVFTGGEGVTGLAHSPENLLRLHVIAHSDAPDEQQVKLEVRDAILEEMGTWGTPHSEMALESLLRENAHQLEVVARSALAQSGFEHGVKVEVGDFVFDERRTGELLLPAGTYRAVRVVIGDGAGRNWWCVLFPPLCFVDEGGTVDVERGGERREVDGPAPMNRLVYERRGDDESGLSEERLTAMAHSDPSQRTQESNHRAERTPEVQWRLRLWESISRSSYTEALREILLASSNEER